MRPTKSLLLCLAACAATTAARAQCQQGTFCTPIQHVIIIAQENRTPDNLFQDPKLITNGANIAKAEDPHKVKLGVCWDIGHSNASWWNDYNRQGSGTFCKSNAYVPQNCQGPPICLNDTYVQGPPDGDNTIKPYWDIAETYGFANYMFQTNEGPSFPAHQFLFGGTSAPVSYGSTWGTVQQGETYPAYQLFNADLTTPLTTYEYGCIAKPGTVAYDIDPARNEGALFEPPEPSPLPAFGYPCYEHLTLADQLDHANLSWRYYGYYDANAPQNSEGDLWNAPNAIQHICQGTPGGLCAGADWSNGDVDLQDWDIFKDTGLLEPGYCNLPAVSWVIPNGPYSDHPGSKYDDAQGGPDWVANIVNAVGTSQCKNPDGSSYWNSTVIFVTWDDWGGFYDHVPPYEVLSVPGGTCDPNNITFGCGYVAGFRVPLLVVSAYTGLYNSNDKTWLGYISGRCQNGSCPNQPPYWHDFGSILNFIQYVFQKQGMAQGNISGTPNWQYDDFWAPDYYANGSCNDNSQTCPFGLSDFFGSPSTGYFKNQRQFVFIQPQKYQPTDFQNLSAWPGGNEPDDLETQ